MPPRLSFHGVSRSLAIRARPSIASHQPRIAQVVSRRGFAEEKTQTPAAGPNHDVLGHVNEEAAEIGNIMRETKPDLSQGTPVQEILKRDQEGRDKAPEIIKEEIGESKDGTKLADQTTFENLLALGQMQNIAAGGHGTDPVTVGHRFGLPELPLPSNANLHYRYDPVVSQVTNLLMQHGKLSVAQRNMAYILNHLRTAPPPTPNPARPLLPGSPPPSHLPLNPVGYLTLAIDSIAPLLRIRSQKGAAGGGNALQIPVPLGLRQRRRTAIQWILDASNKKRSRGSGKAQFAQRFAEEIISVVEGKSNAWERRMTLHKTGTSSRANLNYGRRRRNKVRSLFGIGEEEALWEGEEKKAEGSSIADLQLWWWYLLGTIVAQPPPKHNSICQGIFVHTKTPNTATMAGHMSLESMLDEERRDVLALLEATPVVRTRGSASSIGSGRASSPFTPRSPVRSMLDIAEDVPSRSASVSSTNGGMTSPGRAGPVRSMLDIDSPPPPPRQKVGNGTMSAQTSPTQANHRAYNGNSAQHRSLSDAATRPAEFGPRSNVLDMGRSNPNSAYQFAGYLPSNPGGPVVPKRNTQAGKKPSAMAEAVRGGDLSVFSSSRDRGRNHSIVGTGISTAKSRSPHNRLGLRSNSPHVNPEKKFVLDDGRVIDMNSAYRRLSDANLALSSGGLSSLGGKSRRRTNSGDAVGQGNSRLEKDYVPVDGEDALVDSSDEDHTSDEESRGRKTLAQGYDGQLPDDHPESTTLGMGRAKGPRTARSLMAAAEEERQEIASKAQATYKVRSLLEPEITITAPSGAKLKSSKPGVHPNTSFDEGTPGLNTPVDSDTEADLTDIKRAQKLSITMTSIMSTPVTSRCVRTIYRGDFAKMQKEAHDNQRRVRKYLVATDLSDEAAHALEWTIGTVLRDGDTLLAIYCVDEELGIAGGPETSGDDATMKEQAAAVAASTKPTGSTPILGPVAVPSPLGPGLRLDSTSASASPMGRERDKSEQERYRAMQDITDRVSKLLRKTKLQVKVVIEVIHCKSPKHLITEVIDYVSPTLVILGSRGRSALKGVILGSFSNYLVTKSSVPVMVARKRLRKHTKYKRPSIRLANNLASPVKSLEKARID
ncbi:hypothetical protein G7Y89_g2751 [Cudoniella acicularis]|uniref:Small ribosomal subunit protein uS7m n=1 Tax=Cudoniella acicularis TaxID=354080 RepID=A0A8H4RVQ6_9HELO|nr:hypothetical protein G7Y89_g2751 [Cudoniella acicularis]